MRCSNACVTQWRRVMSQLRSLEGRGADQASYHIAMGSLGAALSWRSCIACMSRMDVMRLSQNIITFNEAMNVCNSADEWEISLLQAASLLSSSHASRLQPDTATPSLVLSAPKPWARAVNVLQEIIEASWHVDAIACNVALSSCTSSWPQHLALLQLSADARSIASYSTAIQACGAAFCWSTALALLEEATACRLRRDAVLLNVLVTALGRGLQWQLALSLLDVTADVMAYNAMMSSLDEASQWRLVSTLFSRMLSTQMEPDALSHAFLSAADWRRGLIALQTSSKIGSKSGFKSLTACNAAITCCSKASSWRLALRLSQGLEPDLVTASALVSAKAASKLWQCLRPSIQYIITI